MKATFNSVIGCTLKQIRLDSGLTQTQVACRLNVTQPFVSRLERGERDLDPFVLFVYSRAVGLTPVKLFAIIAHALYEDERTSTFVRNPLKREELTLWGFHRQKDTPDDKP